MRKIRPVRMGYLELRWMHKTHTFLHSLHVMGMFADSFSVAFVVTSVHLYAWILDSQYLVPFFPSWNRHLILKIMEFPMWNRHLYPQDHEEPFF